MATEMKLITDITLELTGETKRYEVVAKQGDKATRFIRITLKNNGQDFEIPAGMKVIANIQKPDRKCCYNTCSYSGSTVTMELTNQALAVAGTAECDIEIRDANDEVVLSSQAFTIEIEKSMRDENAIRSSNEFTQLEQDVRGYAEEYFKENPVSGMTSDQIMALDGMLKLCAFTENPSNQYTMFCKAFGIGIQEPEPSREIYLSEYCVFETGDALGINSSDKRIGVKVSYDFEIGDTIKLISPIGDSYMLAVGCGNYAGPWIGGGYLDVSNEYTFSDSDISGGYGKVLLIKRTDEAVIQQDDIDNIKICLVVIKHG